MSDGPPNSTDAATPPAHSIQDALAKAADPQARHALLAGFLQERIGRALNLDAARLAPHAPLDRLGIDSLMAIELQHEIESSLGMVAPISLFLDGRSIDDLAATLMEQIENPAPGAAVALHAAGGPDEHPASHGQRALWFLQQIAPENAAYNLYSAFRICGALDLAALRRAFQMLVDRHPALRATFADAQGELRQRTNARAAVSFEIMGAAGWSDERLRDHLSGLAQRPFDLARGPLLRVEAFVRSAQEHIILVAVHHIVSDFWSLVTLLDELGRAYPAALASEPAALAPLHFQYADYVRWQADLLASAEGERLWDYWRRQLAEPLPVLNLPTDRPRPAVQSYRGAAHAFRLDADLTGRIRALAQSGGATLYSVLLAGWMALLHRYTGQRDLLVGSPTAGRSRAGLADLVGYFVNPVVLRADLSGDPSFAAFAAQIRQTALAALAHQEYPFAVLVDRLRPERDPSYSPLFQALFVLEQPQGAADPRIGPLALGVPGAQLDLAGLRLEAFPLDQRTAQFDLALSFEADEQGLRATLRYAADLFLPPTIARMAGHLRMLLAGAVADPARRVSDLPLLTPEEERQILVTWNDTQARFADPEELCAHRLVEAQAARSPDAVALVCEERHLTYGVANARANQLARHLRALGIGMETRVGIWVERSLETTLAFLAVFKAGGAYVPIDPAYPPDRIAYMLDDSQAPVLIISDLRLTVSDLDSIRTTRLGGGLGAGFALLQAPAPYEESPAAIVNLRTDWPAITRMSDRNLAINVTPENLAYVMYTSGSTGVPKGVMTPHRGVGNRVLWMRGLLGLNERDRMMHKASFGFDASVWEMFLPLSMGACLVVARAGAQHDNAHLVDLIVRERLTMVHFVPSLLKPFLDQPGLEACTTVRRAWCGGEALALELRQRFYARFNADLYNGYGPTEGTINATYWPCDRDDAHGIAPIGRPIPNYQVYILDARMRPVPIGIPGELYIGGIGVARGYQRRPDLTAEKFVPNPFGTMNDEDRTMKGPDSAFSVQRSAFGTRLYRTGDLTRYLPDGNIEFLGRTDHQVKLRGVRIELGEIEAALRQHPRVRSAVVLVWEDPPGDKRLAAYVVPSDEVGGTSNEQTSPGVSDSSLVTRRSSLVGELREWLNARLPAYIVPAAFVLMDAMPVTPNGKLDLRALPPPQRDRADADASYVAPRTPAERVLARVWAEALGVARVGVYDNFFALGGDSILSIQIVGRAQQAGLRITPNQIFQRQTVADLAEVAVGAQAGHAEQEPLSGALPLTPIQRRFFEQLPIEPHHWNQALLLAARRLLDPRRLRMALDRVLAHHDALRLRFTPAESGWVQSYARAAGADPFVRVDLSALPAARRSGALTDAATDLQASLNLSAGPLLRMALFDLGPPDPTRVLIVVHHLAIDGVSWRILLEDLQAAYEQIERGDEVALPLKTASYRRWAERLVEVARSDDLAPEVAYWLAPASAGIAPLPKDRRDGDNREDSAGVVTVALSADETRALLHDVHAAYHTQINDILLTALAQALARWTGERRLLVDLEWQGREDLLADGDVARTVGWFTALFPVLLDLGASEHPGENLKAIKERLRGVPGRGLGYGLLRYLRGDAALAGRMAAQPQAELIFNYLGQFDQVIDERALLAPAEESPGPLRSPRAPRRYLLEINGMVLRGALRFEWRYGEGVHQRATIERAAHDFTRALRELIDHCLAPDAGGYTPSDFGAFNWSQSDLDDIIGGISKSLSG